MNYRSLLVITYGRTGSTLLQGVLNSIDGCLIRGENYGMCKGLFNVYRNMIEAKKHPGDAPTEPWYGCQFLNEDYLIEHGRELMRRVVLGDRAADNSIECYGFKETRYVNMKPDFLYDYIDFVAQLFPDPAIVFNTRELAQVVKSAWWKEKDEERTAEMLQQTEKVFDAYAAKNSNCFQITYEDVVGKTKRLESLFEFLGAPYNLDKIESVLSRPHSYDPTQPHVGVMFASRRKGDRE